MSWESDKKRLRSERKRGNLQYPREADNRVRPSLAGTGLKKTLAVVIIEARLQGCRWKVSCLSTYTSLVLNAPENERKRGKHPHPEAEERGTPLCPLLRGRDSKRHSLLLSIRHEFKTVDGRSCLKSISESFINA